MERIRFFLLAVPLALLVVGCANTTEKDPIDSGVVDTGVVYMDLGNICADPSGDDDADKIPNGQEGCLNARDSDGDGTPDYRDLDSDGDKVPDNVESGKKDASGKCADATSGQKGWPCDTDGDKLPDYLDKDADGDGLLDGDEDVNGDGLVGCCLAVCKVPGSTYQQKCLLTTDGCGQGQKCQSGKCKPDLNLNCSEGETSPKKKDTFGDGVYDTKRGTFICRDATEANPIGRRAVLLRQDKTGDWHLALDKNAKYGVIKVAGASGTMAAAAVDFDKSTDEVAGFVISKASTGGVQTELANILSAINSSPPGGSGTVTVLSTGTGGKSHDKYDMVQNTYLQVVLGSGTDVSTARNSLVATLLGKSTADLTNVPQSFGSSASTLAVRFSVIKRFDFKKDSSGKYELDAKGFPVDSGDTNKWQLLVIGAVANLTNYRDPKRSTGVLVDDLANGSSLALASDKVGNSCEADTMKNVPRADILWVSDESGSMNDNRQDVTKNSTEFFKRAVAMGLDFRMGITNVIPLTTQVGYAKFCSRISSNKSDTGGTDRFLLPSEEAIFTSCIYNPPGYTGGTGPGEHGLVNARDALKGHLPKAPNDQSKFRTGVPIIIVVLTDQIAQYVRTEAGSHYRTCTLPVSTQAAMAKTLQPLVDLFTGVTDPEATISKFLVLGGVCNNKCNAMIAHGYRELVKTIGGMEGDVCQKNLNATMQAFLDTIVASASPFKLNYVPISSSLAASVDGTVVGRSRWTGFDYNINSNTLVFINVKYQKGSVVFTSYKRWERQLTIK